MHLFHVLINTPSTFIDARLDYFDIAPYHNAPGSLARLHRHCSVDVLVLMSSDYVREASLTW